MKYIWYSPQKSKYPLYVAWLAGRDVAKHTARVNIDWLTGSDVRTSSNFAESIRNFSGFNGIKWQEMHKIHLFYNKTIVDLCFGRHGVLLNSKLNHIDQRGRLLFSNTPCPPQHSSASANMTLTVQ